MDDHVALIEEFAALFMAGDRDGAIALLHPAFRIQQPASLPHGGWHVGPAGLAAMGVEFARHWTRTVGEAEIMAWGDDFVIQMTNQTWEAKATGRSATVDVLELFTFADGLLASIRVFQQDTHLLLQTLA